MNKKTKIILGIVIVIVLIIGILSFQHIGGTSVDEALRAPEQTSDVGNKADNNSSVSGSESQVALASGSINALSGQSLEDAPPPPNEDSTDSDIDTYLKAYRTAEQPDPNDFNDSFSDLK